MRTDATTLPNSVTKFQPGDHVIHTASAGETGIVVRMQHRFDGQEWYKVRFGNITKDVCESSLSPLAQLASLADILARTRSVPAALRRAVTARKIALGMRDLVYSLGATKTKQYSYQFKPLLKLLESRARRILVADEVGLGKTIEAGYVVMERIARDPGARVVIVCPAGLRTKWKNELANRFGLRFDIIDRPTAVRRVAAGMDGPDDFTLRAIVSYETIRCDEFTKAINEEEGPSLLVVDEAHRARRSSTSTAQSVHRLGAASDWVVYLTATPIQTSDEDLFTLLHALDADEFPSLDSFRERAQLNRHVVDAESALRTPGLEGLRTARAALERARGARGARMLVSSPYFEETVGAIDEAMRDHDGMSEEDRVTRRVELQSRLFDINLLSPFYTRTRRRNVHTNFAERKVITVARDMTPYEAEVTDQLLRSIYAEYRRQHGSGIARLVLVSYQMQLASSLTGAIRNIRAKIGERFEAEEDELDLVEDLSGTDALDGDDAPPRLQSVFEALRNVDVDRLEREDSKWDALWEILESSAHEARSRGKPAPKAIVFSFYRASLDVIERKLRAHGVGYRRIDGSVPHDPVHEERDEKGRRIREFRDDPEARILLASQVGSEGLDLQFADTVINWDLPWNPMVVEQRIGRVDRLGQESPVVKAFSIVLRGTVEERVLARLYERLQVFREHIGECEQVIGEQLGRLHREIFERSLTPEQIEERLVQAQYAVQRNRLLGAELEQKMDALVGQEQFLIDRIDHLKRTGRYIAPEELESFVLERLRDVDPSSTMVRRPDGVTWEFRAGAAFCRIADQARERNDPMWRDFINAIRTQTIALTFLAEDRKGTTAPALVHAMHPLVKVLVHQLRNGIEEEVAAIEATIASTRIPAGTYVLAVLAAQDSTRTVGASLLAAAEPLHGGEPLSHALADELLSEIVVRGGTDLAGMSPAEPDVRASFDRVETRLGIRLAEYARATATSERNRRQRLRATIERDADQQLERVRAAIEAIEAFGGDAQASKSRQILPIYRAREQRIEETRRRRLEELEQSREPELSGATFAAGVVTVLAGTTGDECQESRT